MKWQGFKKNKVVRTILLGIIALTLLFLSYYVLIQNNEDVQSFEQNVMNETEQKLCKVLSEIDGVGKITAYVNQDGSGQPMGAIIVCEGADRLSVRLNVVKAAAMALSVDQTTILIYKMTDQIIKN